jgi:hypothetical protein
MPAAEETFESYANTGALLAAWPETDAAGFVTVTLDTTTPDSGTKCVKFDASGNPDEGGEAFIRRTFTGLEAGTAYRVSVKCWLNADTAASYNHVGIRVEDALDKMPSVGVIQAYRTLTVIGVADIAGQVRVDLGIFDTGGGTDPNRYFFFDGLEITASPWDDVLLDSGVLTVSGLVVGYTQGGGFKFDLERKLVQYEVEGVPTDLVGFERILSIRARFTGTLIEADDRVMQTLEPGVASATDGDTTTYTPLGTLTTLTAGQYLTDAWVTWRKLGGGHLRVRFPKAICTQWGVTGKDKAEGQIAVTIEARLASGAAVTDAPYAVDLIAA